MLKNIINGVAGSILLGLGVNAYDQLQKLNVDKSISILIIVCAGAILIFIFSEVICKLHIVANLISPYTKYKGTYFQRIKNHPEVKFAISSIGYINNNDMYVFSGEAFDSKFNSIATWRSSHLSIDVASDKILYEYVATISSSGVKKFGFGMFEFRFSDSKKGSIEANDSFVGLDSKQLEHHTSIVRKLDKKLIEGVLAKTSIETSEDRIKLLKALSNEG